LLFNAVKPRTLSAIAGLISISPAGAASRGRSDW
jgi:hypothetical protein